jgi:hypothetical protein
VYSKTSLILAGAAVAVLSLAGCDDIKRGLGITKVIPDEFAVVPNAPLSVPPDYALRPPRPGAPRDQETSPIEQAKQTVFRQGDTGQLPPTNGERSAGEGELLRQAGAGDAPTNIRQLISRDRQEMTPVEGGLVDKLLFWKSADKTLPADQPIDATQEALRLRGKDSGQSSSSSSSTSSTSSSSTAANSPAASANTPTIERTQEKSFWDKIF